ncbi:MAG TPA: hypothetical protein VHR67_12050, partial [Aestuariivirgaceae bacterium]|nr:hypothetical protein [Aestuariivirgaceae bacterium]
HCPLLKAGRLWVPAHARYTQPYVEEMCSFPDGPDDQVDATVQALTYMQESGLPPPKQGARSLGTMDLRPGWRRPDHIYVWAPKHWR